jgi:hypothetical protein
MGKVVIPAALLFPLLWLMLSVADGQCHIHSFELRRKLIDECYKSYRLRIVSISCDPNYKFSIDNHQLTIIEVDGINVRPLVVDSLQIFAGILR